MGRPQLEMVVDDPREVEREQLAESDADMIGFTRLLSACRDVALTFGYDKTANALDRLWSRHGRPVSASFLRASLNPEPESKSYFRLEWTLWFSRHSSDVRDLLIAIGVGDSEKEPQDDLDDLRDEVRAEFGRAGERVIQRAKVKRKPKVVRR